MACLEGSAEVLRLLLGAGGNLSITDGEGNTPETTNANLPGDCLAVIREHQGECRWMDLRDLVVVGDRSWYQPGCPFSPLSDPPTGAGYFAVMRLLAADQ